MFTPISSPTAAPRAAFRRALAFGTAISLIVTGIAAAATATLSRAWRFGFDTAAYGSGPHTIVTRVVYGGVELARQTAAVKFN